MIDIWKVKGINCIIAGVGGNVQCGSLCTVTSVITSQCSVKFESIQLLG